MIVVRVYVCGLVLRFSFRDVSVCVWTTVRCHEVNLYIISYCMYGTIRSFFVVGIRLGPIYVLTAPKGFFFFLLGGFFFASLYGVRRFLFYPRYGTSMYRGWKEGRKGERVLWVMVQ